MNTALLLIDIQNDYFPKGAMELPDAESASAQAAMLLQAFRQKNWSVIHIQHVSLRDNAAFFVPNTRGVKLHPSVEPDTHEVVFEKHYPNSFRGTSLLGFLRELDIQRLVMAGMMTNRCIDSTVRAAADHGFDCVLARDACAASDLWMGQEMISAHHVHLAFTVAIDGVFAQVQTAQEICASLS